MGKDLFSSRNSQVPADDAAVITPNDSSELDIFTRAIYVGGAGDIKVKMVGSGDNITFVGVPAGSILPIRVRKVYTDTTATNLIALY